ncbi:MULTISPECIES: DUF1491 family protein [unclassified Aureimonas]|uniref:DUF1491 family protein n=1 Tax=unclassified Aureimonas TaxID=2615206 RepID=UPI000700AB86|nr:MULTISPECIES: DUF1491 family protein [unclassified Aureimonas]KQT55258.1 hypothetical protein ASG62_10510 [Aureimonas sp. Leaf427]KQT71049.1 hypothetical protein ASG54_20895 [Aureimonas sp. Leaf460]
MRVTSDFFASSLVRRVFGDGGFAAVERRGAEAAGAIFVIVRHRDGTLDLYGPASQTHSAEDGGRRFMREALADEAALEARFQREARFDPDFWVVEIETGTPETYIEIVED